MAPAILAVLALCAGAAPVRADYFAGTVSAADGAPIEGAMVTFSHGEPAHEVTVYSDADGAWRTPALARSQSYRLRVRRVGWKDLSAEAHLESGETVLPLVLERETDPAAVAGQLPANRWFALVLEQIEDERQREELVRQCTYCHQQGNWATRMLRPEEQWDKVLHLMARMGAGLSSEVREQIPELFNRAYALETAVPRLTERMHEPDFAPPPAPEVRRAVVEEWALGHQASMQHDLMVHPDGRIYTVDMMQDKLYRLDPRAPDGARASFDLPRGDLLLGGVFGSGGSPIAPNANAHVGPHSLQHAPDGGIWITLALGNQLGRFDPVREEWTIVEMDEGYYPHTLRFDGRGRVWYTVAASNHVGVYDPASGEHQWIRLPAPTWGQAITSRMLPFFLWLGRTFDLSEAAASGEGIQAPVPYGVDVAPNGDVWVSQLNAHRLARIDPDTFEVEIVETPFTGPRRMRFDSRGKLWIPAFSAGLIARFDPDTREFETWPLPIEPAGSETPYALNVDRRTDTVWICGTNSDSLIRFEPEPERFTVYPLPTRVTYTREIDFDQGGGVWASNSNMPTWQIEGAIPKVLRLDPDGLKPRRHFAEFH